MTTPLVSVIIPTFNRSHYLLEAVDSVLSQTYQNVEPVVVDDGSTDNTVEAIAPIRERITLIQQENAGRSSARNRGIHQSNGDFIVFLDSDDLLLPDSIRCQVEYLEGHPAIDVIYGNGHTLNPDSTYSPLEPFVKSLAAPSQIGTEMLVANLFAIHAAMVRRDALPAPSAFDESLSALEDWDLWLRLLFSGATFAYHNAKIAVYRRHSGNTDTAVPASLIRARALITAKVVGENLDRNMSEEQRRLFRLQHMGALMRFGSPLLILRALVDVLFPLGRPSGHGLAALIVRAMELTIRTARNKLFFRSRRTAPNRRS